MNTEIIVITDRSGSMGNIRQDAIGGFNSFIEAQKLIPGEAKVTSVIFDNEIETQYEAVHLSEVPSLCLEPRGMTAILDAIGSTLETQGKRFKEQAWAELVIVVVITDGMENSSSLYTKEKISIMIKHAEDHGWKFVFLAANQDAIATGASYGFSAKSSQNFTADSLGTRTAYDNTSAMVTSMRTQQS